MDNFIKFMQEYDEHKKLHPNLYIHIKEFSREPKRWRVHVFGREMIQNTGDAELVFAEAESREEAFRLALEKLKEIENQIYNLKEIHGCVGGRG